jgi:hypothetical protein
MDSDDEMLVRLLEDEQDFDDDIRENLSIIPSLRTCLTPRWRSRRGRAAEV